MSTRQEKINAITKDWVENPRWAGIERGYTADEVVKLQGSVVIEQTLASRGAKRLWNSLHTEPFVNALGALTGNQAMQQVKAGLQAIYLSGWQVAADANNAGQMYPDQSLYPAKLESKGVSSGEYPETLENSLTIGKLSAGVKF